MLLAAGAAGQNLGKQPTVVATGNWPLSVATGNVDPDGFPDLVYCDPPVAGISTGCHLLHGDGKGGFSLEADFAERNPANRFSIGFANAPSGFSDVVTLATRPDIPHQMSFLIQTGNEAGQGSVFQTQGNSAPIPGPIQQYLFFTSNNNSDDTGFLLEDTGNGYLYSTNDLGQPLFTMALPDGPGPFLWGDFNGDGINDILVLGSTTHSLTPYFGVGDGTFTVGTPYTLAGGIFSMLVGDINGDGISDLVVEGANGAPSVYLGTAKGFAATARTLTGAQNGGMGSGGNLVRMQDLNDDGIADIVTSTPAGVSVLLGQGNLSYKAGPSYNAGPGRSSYALQDFNGDGHLDLAVDSPEGIAILYGDGNGGFDVGVTANTGQPAYSMTLGKFTASGNVDAVVATGVPQVQMMQGDGAGNFVALGAASPAGAAETNAGRTVWSHVVAGDFDRDGNLDVVSTLDGPISVDLGPCCSYPASADGMSVQYGDGHGSIGAPQVVWPVVNDPKYGGIAEGDLLGRSDIDFLYNFDGGKVVAYASTPQGVPTSEDFASDGPYFIFTSLADGNQHPYAQFALGQFTQGSTLGTDMVQQFLSPSSGANFMTVTDHQGGMTNEEVTLAVPAGYVAPDLPTSTLPATGMYVSAMALQDLDGDGYGDLEVLYHNLAADPANPSATTPNLLYIYWGYGVGSSGDGSFNPTPEIVSLSRNYYEMAVADVNGDGKRDLVLSDGYLVNVLAGDGTRSGFLSETHYLAGMGINGLAVQDVNGDGKLEIVAANGGAVLSSGVVNGGVLAANAEVNTGGLTVFTANAAATTPTLATVSGTVTASPNPVSFSGGIAFSASLAGTGTSQPSGSVTFFVGSLQICTAALASGDASCTYTYNPGVPPIINAGTYTVTAMYTGDSTYAAATLTGTVPLVVTQVPTATTLIDLVTSIFYGQIIADVAVEQVSPTPDGGTLDFLIDGAVTCSLLFPEPPNTSFCPTGPGGTGVGYDAGTYTVQSVYSGDTNYLASSTPMYTVVVRPDPTSATLAASTGTSSTVGQSVTFTATIADVYTTARGTVDFFDGGAQIGTGTVNAQGQASLITAALAVGTHSLTACLVASLDFLASSPCGSLMFTVNPVVVPPPPPPPPTGTFTLAVNPAVLSIGVGNSLTAQVVVTALNGYSQPVQLACSGLPHETTCTFVQSLIGAGGGATGMIVSPAAPHTCGSSTPDFVAPNVKSGMVGLALGGLALLGLRRRRWVVKALALVVCFSVLPMLGGCGSGCKDFGTEPTNYTFTVTATSTGTPVTVLTQVVTLKVHL